MAATTATTWSCPWTPPLRGLCQSARGVAGTGGLAGPSGTLAPLGSSQLGLHAALAPLADDVFNQGHLAVQLNVGTLVKPITKAAMQTTPSNLFSHSDQQEQWQRGQSFAGNSMPSVTGWGGRVADLSRAASCPWRSRSRQQRLHVRRVLAGACRSAPATASPSGALATPPPAPLFSLYQSLLTQPYANAEERAAASVLNQAIKASTALNTALSMNSSLPVCSAVFRQPRSSSSPWPS